MCQILAKELQDWEFDLGVCLFFFFCLIFPYCFSSPSLWNRNVTLWICTLQICNLYFYFNVSSQTRNLFKSRGRFWIFEFFDSIRSIRKHGNSWRCIRYLLNYEMIIAHRSRSKCVISVLIYEFYLLIKKNKIMLFAGKYI